MVEINMYWFWWTSTAIYPLSLIEPGTPLSFVAANLGVARVALETMSGSPRAFPKTSERMRQMAETINAILPSRTPGEQVQNRRLTPLETVQLRNGANAIALTLEEEARHSYVLCVEDQRCLSAHSLVEKIENCFAEESWSKIENAAKREFEESGKCLALERYTGAGFHALRGVECVIRQYIKELTGALPAKKGLGSLYRSPTKEWRRCSANRCARQYSVFGAEPSYASRRLARRG